MSLKRKKRSLSVDMDSEYLTYRTEGIPLVHDTEPSKFWRGQITDSEGHPRYNQPYSGFDTGGEFFTEAHYVDPERSFGSYSGHNVSPDGLHSIYHGSLTAGPALNVTSGINMPDSTLPGHQSGWLTPSVKWPNSLASSDSALDALGSTAIARVKPTTSPAALSTALGELIHDGLPDLIGARLWEGRAKDAVRNSGSEYLNAVFGWQPLISDIKKTASAIKHMDELMTQYERDAGKLVRRRYEFPIETSTGPIEDLGTSFSGGYVFQNGRSFQSVFRTSMAHLFRRKSTYRKVWFSGGFTYHLPADYNSRNELRRHAARASHFLGLEVTPEVIWNLAPWTWALDWFGNTGDVLSNISDAASDGLVLPYSYIMEHTIHTWEYWVPAIGFKSGTGVPPTTVCVTETKRRRRATPFGFGLSWDSFSPRQLAILGALGISRFA